MFTVGIDQGTSSTRAFRLFADGRFEALASITHRQIYPHPGWVEHDAQELLNNVEQCVRIAGGAAGIGLANQGETVIAWNRRTGEPLCNAIVWQDNRTADVTDRLKVQGADALTLERAGLPLDPYFSASKLRWMLDHVSQARALATAGQLGIGTTDAFFLDRLCGLYATDTTTASRTSLMNLRTGQWDEALCDLFGVPPELLPAIQPTLGEFGPVQRTGTLVCASAVDQQAALFGHGCEHRGDTKITFGTGAFALAVTGSQPLSAPESGLLPTVAWSTRGAATYAVDGGVYNASSALDWARRIGLYAEFAEIDRFEAAPAVERDLVFVPALSGLACPYWDRSAAGLWLGMGLETSRLDLVQAVLEGVALRAAQLIDAMQARLQLSERISVDGGLVQNGYFRRFLANALDRSVTIPATQDLTGLGISRMAFAGLPSGASVLPPAIAIEQVVVPDAPLPVEAHARFRDAVERARRWRGA